LGFFEKVANATARRCYFASAPLVRLIAPSYCESFLPAAAANHIAAFAEDQRQTAHPDEAIGLP